MRKNRVFSFIVICTLSLLLIGCTEQSKDIFRSKEEIKNRFVERYKIDKIEKVKGKIVRNEKIYKDVNIQGTNAKKVVFVTIIQYKDQSIVKHSEEEYEKYKDKEEIELYNLTILDTETLKKCKILKDTNVLTYEDYKDIESYIEFVLSE